MPTAWKTRDELTGTFVCFFAIWALFDRSANAIGSFRGEAGLGVCALVVLAAVAAEWVISRRQPLQAIAKLGFRGADVRVTLWTLLILAVLLLYFPLFVFTTGIELGIRDDAEFIAVGMFAQGGVAEEVLFRGFLFRRLRQRRTFWRAARLSTIPFAAVHALLFLTLDFPIAIASFLLSLSLSFPLAKLFELSGGSIWPCAMVHAVVQAAIKIVVVDERFALLATGWMILCGTVPWAIFLIRQNMPNRAEARS